MERRQGQKTRRAARKYGTTVKEDEDLIRETLAGVPAAFGKLVQKYQDRLYNTMLHVVGDADETLDVVQEAFVQAFLNLPSFQGNSAFYTWLYRIAFNVAATHHRRRKSTQSFDQLTGDQGHQLADPDQSPIEKLQVQERCERVRRAIATLSEDHRAILALRDLEGYSYEEIATILDIPVGTVRSRLHRARMELYERLKAWENELF
ncbi:MAG: sigma-70 family RNA polymerase sigma factor [Thermogutta sp.]